MKRISIHILIAVILLLPFIVIRFQNKKYDRLSGKDGKLTIAHVYKVIKGKGLTYYYFYKVNNQLYSSSSSGWNVDHFLLKPIQTFIVAYDEKKPSRNTVLWDKKIDVFQELGTFVPSVENQDKIIKRHTLSWVATGGTRSLNEHEELQEYRQKLALHYEYAE